jgi:membrane protease YdiL (CAAX protease family)
MVLVVLAGNVYVGTFGLPLAAILVFAWAYITHTPLEEFGFVRPRSWFLTVVAGIALGAVFKLVMKALVMPLLGAPPVNQAYSYLTGNTAALPGAIWTMLIVAGLGEETVFRGFLLHRGRRLLGDTNGARAVAVIAAAAIFGAAHYWTQGIPGVQQATIFGLVFGAISVATRRLWLLIVAHAAFDLTALALIYWDLERAVATSVFS